MASGTILNLFLRLLRRANFLCLIKLLCSDCNEFLATDRRPWWVTVDFVPVANFAELYCFVGCSAGWRKIEIIGPSSLNFSRVQRPFVRNLNYHAVAVVGRHSPNEVADLVQNRDGTIR